MFKKIRDVFDLKSKVVPVIMSLMDDDVFSQKGRQIIRNNPQLLTQEVDQYMESWLNAFDLSDDDSLEAWLRLFYIRRNLDDCRKLGLDKASEIRYPAPDEIIEALSKLLETDILIEQGPKVLEENEFLLSEFAISLLDKIIKSPKRSEVFDGFEEMVDFLVACQSKGVTQFFLEERLILNNTKELVEIFSLRPRTIFELGRMLQQYPYLRASKFIEVFEDWANSMKDPLIRKNFLARSAFIKQVISLGFEAAMIKQQEDPEMTMLHDTVNSFLLSDTLEEAADILRTNKSMLSVQAVQLSDEFIRDVEKKDARIGKILNQRHDFLVLSHALGIEQAYIEKSVIANPKTLEKVLDIFFDGDWTDLDSILDGHKELLTSEFEKIADRAILSARKSGEAKLADNLEIRLEIIREYKKPGSGNLEQNRRFAYLDAILHKFIFADIGEARLMVRKHSWLILDSTDHLLERLAELHARDDEMISLACNIKRKLLRRCVQIGVDQAFSEYLLSRHEFMPENVPEKYKSTFDILKQVKSTFTPDEMMAVNNLQVKNPAHDFDDFPGTIYAFMNLRDDKEIAEGILEHPELLSNNAEKFLLHFLEGLGDQNDRKTLERKISILQDCKQHGVRETLSPLLGKS